MPPFTRNHYVPQWYQRRFLPQGNREQKFYYLDTHPEVRTSNGRKYTRRALLRWGPPRCFYEDHLYTTRFGQFESTEIEERFFGEVDAQRSIEAVDYFSNFQHPSVGRDELHNLLIYMSLQKIRTPKGLAHFASLTGLTNRNAVLFKMQELHRMYCALWTECVWAVVDASECETKFIVSDHPVTVYNEACFPQSKHCRGVRDPEIWLSGTFTIFPLCLDKALILTNLSWARNPYGDPLKPRPNPNLFRGAIFNFQKVQTGRKLTDTEVQEINYIIKARAHRYIAAAKEEWLYPERTVNSRWDQLGDGYLLFPDPRSMDYGGEVIFGGFADGRPAQAFDEYGRRPWQPGYRHHDRGVDEREWNALYAFKGEFARVFGPRRRGNDYDHGQRSDEDSPDFHKFHLSQEKRKPKTARKRARGRRNRRH